MVDSKIGGLMGPTPCDTSKYSRKTLRKTSEPHSFKMSLIITSEDVTDDSGRREADNTSPTTSAVRTLQARKNARRSSMFRRDVLSSQESGSDNLMCSSPVTYQAGDVKTSGSSPNHAQHDIDAPRISLSDYEKALQTEKEEWSITRRSRSNKYHDLNTKLKSRKFDTITMESCADMLSSEDRKFMSERPKYVQIANSARDLKEEVLVAMGMKKTELLRAKVNCSAFNKELEVVDCKAANLD